jgi:hypothetical protein
MLVLNFWIFFFFKKNGTRGFIDTEIFHKILEPKVFMKIQYHPTLVVTIVSYA